MIFTKYPIIKILRQQPSIVNNPEIIINFDSYFCCNHIDYWWIQHDIVPGPVEENYQNVIELTIYPHYCAKCNMTSVELGQKCWLVSSMYVRHNQTRLASKALFLPDEQIISQKTGLFSKCQGVRQENNMWSKAAAGPPRCRAITNQKKVLAKRWHSLLVSDIWAFKVIFLVRKIVNIV